MRGHITRALFATAAAAGALLTFAATGAAASGTAATGMARIPVVRTAGHGGYVTTGRHFRYISTRVTVPPARTVSQYAAVVLGGAGVPAPTLGVKAGGGSGSVGWALGPPFHMAGGTMNLRPAPGDVVRLSIYYQKGHISFTATDTTKRVSQTARMPVKAGTLYTAAEAAVVENGYAAPVANDFQLWSFRNTHVTTYSGITGTLLGPWVTSKVVAVNGRGAVVMSPSVLFSNGAAFNVLRR